MKQIRRLFATAIRPLSLRTALILGGLAVRRGSEGCRIGAVPETHVVLRYVGTRFVGCRAVSTSGRLIITVPQRRHIVALSFTKRCVVILTCQFSVELQLVSADINIAGQPAFPNKLSQSAKFDSAHDSFHPISPDRDSWRGR